LKKSVTTVPQKELVQCRMATLQAAPEKVIH